MTLAHSPTPLPPVLPSDLTTVPWSVLSKRKVTLGPQDRLRHSRCGQFITDPLPVEPSGWACRHVIFCLPLCPLGSWSRGVQGRGSLGPGLLLGKHSLTYALWLPVLFFLYTLPAGFSDPGWVLCTFALVAQGRIFRIVIPLGFFLLCKAGLRDVVSLGVCKHHLRNTHTLSLSLSLAPSPSLPLPLPLPLSLSLCLSLCLSVSLSVCLSLSLSLSLCLSLSTFPCRIPNPHLSDLVLLLPSPAFPPHSLPRFSAPGLGCTCCMAVALCVLALCLPCSETLLLPGIASALCQSWSGPVCHLRAGEEIKAIPLPAGSSQVTFLP